MIQAPNSGLEEAEAGAAGQIQAETHPSHLTDAAQRSQRVACPHDSSMDTYRPKRPTTLNLFPQVPRTQVINRFRKENAQLNVKKWCLNSALNFTTTTSD